MDSETKPKRKAIVLDRDPFDQDGVTRQASIRLGLMQKLADADLVVVVKGDEARLIKLAWEEPLDYDVEVIRP
jgi:hypothetical protein